jgi:hypothetical protein
VVSSVPFQLRYLHRELHELQEGETYSNTSEAKVNIERRREKERRGKRREEYKRSEVAIKSIANTTIPIRQYIANTRIIQ